MPFFYYPSLNHFATKVTSVKAIRLAERSVSLTNLAVLKGKEGNILAFNQGKL